jgi:hypothetical protein
VVLRKQVRPCWNHAFEFVHRRPGKPVSFTDGGGHRLLIGVPRGGQKSNDAVTLAGMGLQLVVVDGAAARNLPALGHPPYCDFCRIRAQGESHLERESAQE